LRIEGAFDAGEFKNRYGTDCWVVVTGFTHGIGLAYAKLFADMGFNLVLIGRNHKKIKHALRWINQYNGQILTKVIDIDLSADD
jgi:short-subunit dehydrogenase